MIAIVAISWTDRRDTSTRYMVIIGKYVRLVSTLYHANLTMLLESAAWDGPVTAAKRAFRRQRVRLHSSLKRRAG